MNVPAQLGKSCIPTSARRWDKHLTDTYLRISVLCYDNSGATILCFLPLSFQPFRICVLHGHVVFILQYAEVTGIASVGINDWPLQDRSYELMHSWMGVESGNDSLSNGTNVRGLLLLVSSSEFILLLLVLGFLIILKSLLAIQLLRPNKLGLLLWLSTITLPLFPQKQLLLLWCTTTTANYDDFYNYHYNK
jgi:hypothetical protein